MSCVKGEVEYLWKAKHGTRLARMSGATAWAMARCQSGIRLFEARGVRMTRRARAVSRCAHMKVERITATSPTQNRAAGEKPSIGMEMREVEISANAVAKPLRILPANLMTTAVSCGRRDSKEVQPSRLRLGFDRLPSSCRKEHSASFDAWVRERGAADERSNGR